MRRKSVAFVGAVCACAVLSAVGRTVKVSDFGYDPEDSTRFLRQALESACVPVAVDTRSGNLTMLFDGGKDATFWFDAPASGTVAMVRGGTYSGSCANVALTDADGQPGR